MSGVISEIKGKLSFADILGWYGIAGKTVGRNTYVVCPFHDDNKPSLRINNETGTFKCYGCGSRGDVIDFYCMMERLPSLGVAVKELADKLHIKVGDEIAVSDPTERALHANAVANKTFLKCAASSSAFADYAKRRDLQRFAEKHAIGYCDEQAWLAVKPLFDEAGLKQPSLVGRVTFPLFDRRGRIVGFQGRAVDDTVEPKYVTSRSSDGVFSGDYVYGVRFARSVAERVYVSEGIIDSIKIGAVIDDKCLSVSTIGEMTEAKARTISRLGREVVIVYDGDEAGVRMAAKAIKLVFRHNAIIKVVVLDGGLDPDDYSVLHGDDELRRALLLGHDWLDFLAGEYCKVASRAQAIDFAVSIAALSSSLGEAEVVASRIAGRFGLRREMVVSRLNAVVETRAHIAAPEDGRAIRPEYIELICIVADEMNSTERKSLKKNVPPWAVIGDARHVYELAIEDGTKVLSALDKNTAKVISDGMEYIAKELMSDYCGELCLRIAQKVWLVYLNDLIVRISRQIADARDAEQHCEDLAVVMNCKFQLMRDFRASEGMADVLYPISKRYE